MNKPITQDEINRLRAPFPLEAHSIREGNTTKDGKKTQWFVYVEKPDVENRLNEVFPGEWGSSQPVLTVIGNTVAATISINIRGIERGNTGEDSNGMEKAKGATTDAFRRAAADWGVAKYLWEMELKIWTPSYEKGDWKGRDEREREALNLFKQWYQKKFAGYKPPNVSKLPPESRQEAQKNDLEGSDHPDIAATQKSPSERLGTPNGQRIGGSQSTTWEYDLPALMAHPDVAKTYPQYEHRANAIKKLHSAGHFESVANISEAVKLLIERPDKVTITA